MLLFGTSRFTNAVHVVRRIGADLLAAIVVALYGLLAFTDAGSIVCLRFAEWVIRR